MYDAVRFAGDVADEPTRWTCVASFVRMFVLGIGVCLAARLFVVAVTQKLRSVDALIIEGRSALARGDVVDALEKGERAAHRAANSVGAWQLVADAAEETQETARVRSPL